GRVLDRDDRHAATGQRVAAQPPRAIGDRVTDESTLPIKHRRGRPQAVDVSSVLDVIADEDRSRSPGRPFRQTHAIAREVPSRTASTRPPTNMPVGIRMIEPPPEAVSARTATPITSMTIPIES